MDGKIETEECTVKKHTDVTGIHTQNRSSLLPGNRGSSHRVVNEAASLRRGQFCLGRVSVRERSGVRMGWGYVTIARTIEVLTNHLELHIESKRVSASCMRF
jgi:hypothetical protein